MNIQEIKNFIKVSDRIASSGQPEENQFKYIAGANYQAVINLAMPNSDNAIPEEGNIVTAHKMTYVHIPVPFDAPRIEHLKTFLNVMDAFSDKKIWIHCVVNMRVSAFLYQYKRLILKEPHEEATKIMLPTWEPDDIWQRFMTHTSEEII